jgi:hypothetical protein
MYPGCHSISAAALGENNAAHEIKGLIEIFVDHDMIIVAIAVNLLLAGPSQPFLNSLG